MKNRILSIAAAVLIVLALATLFLDGVSLSADVMSQAGDMFGEYGNLMRQSAQDVDIDELARAFGLSTSDFSSAFDAQKSLDVMKRMMGMFTSGGLSMMEVRGALSGFASLARSYNSLAAMTGSSGDELKYVNAVSIAYTAFVVLMFLLGAWALYGVYLRRKARGIPFAVFMMIILIADAIIAFAINESISSSGVSVQAVSVTGWAVLGFLLSVGSVVLCFMAANGGEKPAIQAAESGFSPAQMGVPVQNTGYAGASRAGASPWTCPRCGARVEAEDRFCGMCGAPKPAEMQPQKKMCPGCGCELDDDAAFCPKCGTRLAGSAQQAGGQPSGGAYQQSQPYAAYQQPQPYAQQENSAYQPAAVEPWIQQENSAYQPAAVEPWIQQSAPQPTPQPTPQPAPAGTGTVRLPVTNGQNLLAMTFEINQDFAGVHEIRKVFLASGLVIGRNPQCDLQIDDETVSGAHLQINRVGESVHVTDLNSTNGTELNGMPLQGEAPLNSGDRLEIGHTLLVVRF